MSPTPLVSSRALLVCLVVGCSDRPVTPPTVSLPAPPSASHITVSSAVDSPPSRPPWPLCPAERLWEAVPMGDLGLCELCLTARATGDLLCACDDQSIPVNAQDVELQLAPTFEEESNKHVTLLLVRKRASAPLRVRVPSSRTAGDLKDLTAMEADFDGDGALELAVTLDHSDSTIGRSWVDLVVIDDVPRAAHALLLLPEPHDLEATFSGVSPLVSDHVWTLRNDPRALWARFGGGACQLLEMHLDTDGNGCNGCTAGGVTSATFRSFKLRDGKLVPGDEAGELWRVDRR